MLHCVCYNSGKRKWQKSQIHIGVYIPLTTEICLHWDVNNLWSPTWNENAYIYIVLFIQRIPGFINYKYECSLCNVPDVLHTQNPVPGGQNLPHPITTFLNISIISQFFIFKKILYTEKSITYTICLLAFAASLLLTSLPPLTWKVNSIRFKTKSNCIGK